MLRRCRIRAEPDLFLFSHKFYRFIYPGLKNWSVLVGNLGYIMGKKIPLRKKIDSGKREAQLKCRQFGIETPKP